jgi:MFS family permease
MRAIGFAALSFGAVVALSATLGMSYRSTASPLDDPTASVSDTSSAAAGDPKSASDPSNPAAADSPSQVATDGSTTAPTDDATPATPTDDATTPAASDSSGPAVTDSASPSDDSGPTDDPTATDPVPSLRAFDITPFAVTNPAYSFSEPNSVDASFDLDPNSSSGDITFGQVDPSTGEDLSTGDPTCVVDTGTTHRDCPLGFESPDHGLWHLIATQHDIDLGPQSQSAYVFIPPAPTITVFSGEGTDFEGQGIAGDAIHVFDPSGTDVCDAIVNTDGFWFCAPEGSFDYNRVFTAVQVDAGDAPADGVLYTIDITPGGISEPATYTPAPPAPSNAPVLQYHFFPGGITVTSTPAEGYDSVFVEWYSWTPHPDESETGGFTLLDTCPYADPVEGTPPPPTGAITCTFGNSSPLTPGVYNPYASQIDLADDGPRSDYRDDYFVVPATPSITRATATSTGAVSVSGTGVATDGIRVIVDGAKLACTSTTVAANGTWACTTAVLKNGTHTLQAYDIDLGAGAGPDGATDRAVKADDGDVVYMTGGLSALSPTTKVKVVSESTTPSASPTDFANWFFTVTGVDLNNVHPGDTFTVSGTGLPPGATVSGELHSKTVSIGSAVVQPDGSFTLPVTVPSDFPAGAHELVMTLTPSGSVAVPSTQPLKVVSTSDSSGSGDSPTPSDSPSPLGSSEGPGIDHHGPNSNILTHGLQSIADVLAHPAKIPAAIEIGLVLLIFAVLPGHLLNATLAEQYERFTKRREERKRGPGRWTRFVAFLHRAPFVAGLALTTATALLFGFADPRFGFSLASLRLFLGLAIALALVSYLTNAVVSRIMQGRWKVDVEVNLRPLGLILTVVGVVVSRLFDFSPGFLIGLVLGLVISEKQLAKHAWRAVLLRTSILLGLALLAWFAFSLFDAKEEGGTFATELAIETLVAITTEAVVGLMVELLPLKLLEGEKLYEKSKVLWGALYLLTVFIFVVAVVPWEGNWAELGSSLWTWIGIVVGFGIVATGVYLFFRIRGHEEHEEHVITDEDDEKLVPIGSEDE